MARADDWLVDNFVPWSFARHPKLEQPYFEEFRPLLARTGGVPGFPRDLAYGHYRADRSVPLPQLQTYFSRLIAFADRRAKVPVFGCVRTSLRVDWFRHHLPGVHLFITRDHRRQFLSYLRQAANGNPYFLERVWVILGNNQEDPAFAPLRRIIDIPVFDGPPQLRDARYERRARAADSNELYQIFYFLHLLTQKTLFGNCDFVIDIDRMSEDSDLARQTEAKIAALTGMAISFADCKIETYAAQLDWSADFFAELEGQVKNLFR